MPKLNPDSFTITKSSSHASIGLCSYVKLGLRNRSGKRSGFTIVELLIVIVVIGILAAVIIVSYIGITQSASSSQTKANATEVAKALSVYKVRNSNGETYPLGTNNGGTISALQTTGTNQPNIPTNINITSYLTDPNGKNYCATVSSSDNSTSYSVSSTSPSPMNGVCVENLAVNPSFGSGNSTGWASWAGTSPNTTSLLVNSDGGFINSNYWRLTWTSVAGDNHSGGLNLRVGGLTAGNAYTCSMRMRLSLNGSIYANWQYGGATSKFYSVGPSGWSLIYISGVVPASTNLVQCNGYISGSTSVSVGSTLDVDAGMFTAGSTLYSYGDGDQPGWFWTGTPNASTSIGPAVAQ